MFTAIYISIYIYIYMALPVAAGESATTGEVWRAGGLF